MNYIQYMGDRCPWAAASGGRFPYTVLEKIKNIVGVITALTSLANYAHGNRSKNSLNRMHSRQIFSIQQI